MSEITQVGADLAKNVIQIHAVDTAGKVLSNRPLPRDKFLAWCVQFNGCTWFLVPLEFFRLGFLTSSKNWTTLTSNLNRQLTSEAIY
jgi:hypothetical protein